MQQGRERDAIQYWYAHGLTNDQGARDVIGTMRWSPGLRRPVLAVRFGVGAAVNAPTDLANNLMPIGSTQQNVGRRPAGQRGGGGSVGPGEGMPGMAAGGSGAPGMSGMPGMPGSGGQAGGGSSSLQSFAGEFGEKLLAAYRTRVESGAFGRIVLESQAQGGVGPTAGAAGYPGGESSGAAPGLAGPGLAGPGLAGPGLAGPGLAGPGMAGAPGNAGGAGGGAVILAPGATFLGLGTQKDLLAKAREQSVDALLLFDVVVKKPARGQGPIINDTKISLIDVSKGKVLFSTRALNNVAVQVAREKKLDDGVEKEINNLFAAIDKELALVDLPSKLTPEIAVARVSSLAASKPDRPLPVLAEMKLYHLLSLVKDGDLVHGYDGIVGEGQGAKLAGGSEEERKAVIQRWLPIP